jgi:S-formylglutathione hydrolase FrmB
MALSALSLVAYSSAPTGFPEVPSEPIQPDRSLPWVTPAVSAPGVRHVVFESTTVGAPVSYHIYLPDAYAADPERRFPVLYWLHGTGGGLGGIGPISAFFAEGIAAGKVPPFLVIFPNGLAESMWTNSRDGRVPMETVVVRDLLSHVDATFRTDARREGRILEGFSMGGRGAGRLGFRFPELFATVSMLGAGPLDADFMGPRAQANPGERARIFEAVWGNDLDYYRADGPTALATQHQEVLRGPMAPRLRLALGAMDFVREDNEAFAVHLDALRIPHAFIVIPGVGHQALPLLAGLGEEGWAFYREALAGAGAGAMAGAMAGAGR